MSIRIKRVYLPAAADDGFRILVDRLWPRGIKKVDAHVDLWLKEVAPSNELRKWFAHDSEKFPEFAERYRRELKDSGGLQKFRAALSGHPVVTLLFAAKDEEHNNAVVLKGLV